MGYGREIIAPFLITIASIKNSNSAITMLKVYGIGLTTYVITVDNNITYSSNIT